MKKYCSNPICNEEFVIPARLGEPVSEFIRLMILGFQKNKFNV